MYFPLMRGLQKMTPPSEHPFLLYKHPGEDMITPCNQDSDPQKIKS